MDKICPKCGARLFEMVTKDMITGEEKIGWVRCGNIRCDYQE